MLYLCLKIRFSIMGLPLIIPIVGAAMQGLGALASYQREQAAKAQADQLAGQPLPEYTPTAQTNEQFRTATAGVANPQGYSGAETSKFQNRLAQILATQQANAQNMGGGGVARAIGAIGNASAINSNADFAASDANLNRGQRNIAQSRLSNIVNQIQGMKNQNTSYAMNRRAQTEQALGNAIRSNRDQWQGSLMNMGGDLLGAGLTSRIGMGGATTATPAESASLGGSLGKTYLSTGSRMNLPNRFRNATYTAPTPNYGNGVNMGDDYGDADLINKYGG